MAALALLIGFEVPFCPTRGLLGIPCPGCGLTRATEAMLRGDFHAMLHFHPLAPIITPVVILAILRVTLLSAGLVQPSRVDPFSRIPSWIWTVFGLSMAGLWILRLFGLLGGTPDPVDPTAGLFYRGAQAIWVLFTSS